MLLQFSLPFFNLPVTGLMLSIGGCLLVKKTVQLAGEKMFFHTSG